MASPSPVPARITPSASRRTVIIRGQVAPPRRPPVPTRERMGTRPDRAALYALLMGVFLVVVAVVSAHP
jgi:hypothetical protein